MNARRLSSQEWERQLGEGVRAVRLQRNLTQEADLARRANIDRTTVGRIEGGEGGTIGSLVQIARALGREDWLNSFTPPAPAFSPMHQLRESQRTQAQQRKRARPRSTTL